MQKSNQFKDYMRKTFVRYAIVLVLLIFVWFILSLFFSFWEAIVQTNKAYNAELSQFLEQELHHYAEGLDELGQDSSLQQALAVHSESNQVRASELLYQFVNARQIKSNFILLNQERELITTNFYQQDQIKLLESYKLKELLSELQTRAPMKRIHDFSFEQLPNSQYLLGQALTQEGEVTGYLLFFLTDLGSFIHTRAADRVVVVDRFNNIIYTSHPSLSNSMGKLAIQNQNHKTIIHQADSTYYLVVNDIQKEDMKVLTMTSIDKFKQSLIIGLVILLGTGILILCLIYLVVPKLIKRNLQAFDSLLTAVTQYKQGNMDYRVKNKTFDEFQTIYDELEHMMAQIQLLMKHNEEIAEHKRRMEIKHLEHQFNPHFVFNVLEMLRYEMLLDPQKASNTVVLFANLMRYYIHYGSGEVLLQTDINYMEDYLRLQKMRFNTRLDYEIDVDPVLLKHKVPKLLLQPIIENSIKHGLEQTKHLLIKISIIRMGPRIIITVWDNGQGIPTDRLEYIKKILHDQDAMPEHIGLYNSHRMIQLLFGSAYGLSIESEYGAGTKVVAQIPYLEEVDNVCTRF